MPQQHLDRLTSIDASFLHQEGRDSHMHIGGVLLFEGPAPDFQDFADHVRSRLHLVPRYRQKLATPPLETGRPLWVDDPDFNLEYHVRHTALPPPGTEDQLFLLASRIASQQLDRSKPLWENWLVEGLADGRFALISKTHHALVDGIAGVDLASVLFDSEREPAPMGEPDAGRAPAVAPGARALAGGSRARWRAGHDHDDGRAGRPCARRGHPPGDLTEPAARRRRGPRRTRVGGPEPGAGDAAQRRDRAPPPLCRRPPAAGRLQGDQGRARRHRQRRRADDRLGSAGRVAALPRRPHGGTGDARARSGVGAHQRPSATRWATN